MSIVIVDYGVGNLRSVYRALQAVGVQAQISADPEIVQAAEMIVLPGQGAFETAMAHLKDLNLVDHIRNHIRAGRPYLGICLGFQLLFATSNENGTHEGLGIFPGTVKHLDDFGIDTSLSIPHMGWNTLDIQSDPNDLFDTDFSEKSVYFVHSYAVASEPGIPISTTTTYDKAFVSSVQQPNLLATQFHPEKSGDVGLSLLRNFLTKTGFLGDA